MVSYNDTTLDNEVFEGSEPLALINCRLIECDFINVANEGSVFTSCEFTNCSFLGSNINNATLERVVFTDCYFNDTYLGDKGYIVEFTNCTLRDTSVSLRGTEVYLNMPIDGNNSWVEVTE